MCLRPRSPPPSPSTRAGCRQRWEGRKWNAGGRRSCSSWGWRRTDQLAGFLFPRLSLALILTLPNLGGKIFLVQNLFSISWPAAVSPWLILFSCLCLLVGLNIFVHLQLTSRLALTDLDSAAAHFALYKLLQSAGTCLGEYIPLLFSGSMSISLCTSTRLCR